MGPGPRPEPDLFPVNLKSGSSAAALWANSSSIYARPYTTDLRPVVPKPDDQKTMSSLNCPLKCTRDDTSNKGRQ